MTRPLLTAYNWAPDEARGLVRDMRVRWALEEVGQPYDVHYLNLGEQKKPAHRARNPFGQVPAFEDDGVVQWESGAIVLHIATRWPGLLPEEPEARAHATGSSPRSTRSSRWAWTKWSRKSSTRRSRGPRIAGRLSDAVGLCRARHGAARLPAGARRIAGRADR